MSYPKLPRKKIQELNNTDKKEYSSTIQGMDHLIPFQVPSLLQHILPSVIMLVLTCSGPVMWQNMTQICEIIIIQEVKEN